MKIAISEHCCSACGRPLPIHFESEICANCQERELFAKVRDFIRENDVTEYDVAEHFKIPHRKVLGWIKEGRIEYKEQEERSVTVTHCLRCGAKVTFGTLCTKCLKVMNGEHQGFARPERGEDGRMRFVDTEEEK